MGVIGLESRCQVASLGFYNALPLMLNKFICSYKDGVGFLQGFWAGPEAGTGLPPSGWPALVRLA